jgi:hypothetical protein
MVVVGGWGCSALVVDLKDEMGAIEFAGVAVVDFGFDW